MSRPFNKYALCNSCKKFPRVDSNGRCKVCRTKYNQTFKKLHIKCTICKKEKPPSYSCLCNKCNAIKASNYYYKYLKKRRIAACAQEKRRNDALHDIYITKLLKKKTDLTTTQLPQELIELKRTQLMLFREIRRQENGQK